MCADHELCNPCYTDTYSCILVHTRTFWYILVHTVIHHHVLRIRMEPPCDHDDVRALLQACVVYCSQHPSSLSLLDGQASQAGLAAPKLPQPRVKLVEIAAPPTVRCSCVGTAIREAWILAPAEHVRDYLSRVTSQKLWDKGNSAHHILDISNERQEGVGDGSYSLITPASSRGPLISNLSSSKVLKKTRVFWMSSGPVF